MCIFLLITPFPFLLCSQLPVLSFSVQNLPFTEPMLAVWAQLVNLAGSKLEKQRMKKSLSRGLAGTSPSCSLSHSLTEDLRTGEYLVLRTCCETFHHWLLNCGLMWSDRL